jgi:hypothetical protein
MAVRWRFDVGSFIRSWPSSEGLTSLPALLEGARDEQRMGLATLALVSTRRDYWVALALIAGYAEEEEQSVPQLIDRLAPTGELGSASAQQVVSWANERPFAADLGDSESVTGAVYTVVTAIRPEALAAAADTGTVFRVCYRRYQPDMGKVWACVRRELSP